jgi:hypothetical protein
VQPACAVRTRPADTGRTSLELKCAKGEIGRVRVAAAKLQVSKESGTARTTVSGSLVEIDF